MQELTRENELLKQQLLEIQKGTKTDAFKQTEHFSKPM